MIDEDVARERALARQKTWATALLVLCALVYVGAKVTEARHPSLPYVAAFAEAAVIGALADWYAVVALFRHPFGIRMPHTAIIPANQARIAENLGEFIARHFLDGARVGERILESDPAAQAGRWIAAESNRRLLSAHAANLLPQAIGAIDRDALRGVLERGVLDRLARVDMAETVSVSLEVITRRRGHHAILDGVMAHVESVLAQPAALDAIQDRIRRELPTLFRFFQADAYVLQKLVTAIHGLLKELRDTPEHPLRVEFDRLVTRFIGNLRTSPDHRARLEEIKQALLEREELRGILIDGWDELVAWLCADVRHERGIVRSGFDAFLGDVGASLQRDDGLRGRCNGWLADAAAALTERHKHEVAGFVAARVKSWDTRHAVRTIELGLGKDLQYIRVNGTLVGGVIGLLIFTLTALFKI